MPNLYIIAGCNGAGKTTASYTVLPEILNCEEFINADEIARGLSPFNPDKAAIEAGRIMLSKIDDYIDKEIDFAFETTLSSRTFVNTIKKAREQEFQINLLFFWLDSVDLAIQRVKNRVKKGGHNIPDQTITRRYFSGISNLFELYIPLCDYWMVTNNSNPNLELVAEGNATDVYRIENYRTFEMIKDTKNGRKK